MKTIDYMERDEELGYYTRTYKSRKSRRKALRYYRQHGEWPKEKLK